MRRALFMAITVIVAACSEPVAMIPGGALGGTSAAPPADWAMLNDIKTIQLEVRPSAPYSVNIWAVGMGANLYVATGADGTRWSPMIEQDARVRARIDGKLYDLRAERVTDPAEIQRVADTYATKYELDAQENWVPTGIIFRLERRTHPAPSEQARDN
jgi:hypothetical protein